MEKEKLNQKYQKKSLKIRQMYKTRKYTDRNFKSTYNYCVLSWYTNFQIKNFHF